MAPGSWTSVEFVGQVLPIGKAELPGMMPGKLGAAGTEVVAVHSCQDEPETSVHLLGRSEAVSSVQVACARRPGTLDDRRVTLDGHWVP